MSNPEFNILEASIEDHRHALDSGSITSVDLVVAYLNRIAAYDICGGLNAFTVFNPKVLQEAAASDARRAAGQPLESLDGIPYTLKDSYKYQGLSVTNGSPALVGLQANEDAFIASRFRAAGAVMVGKTNMTPMAAGGMQRGLYGRAENPYNSTYLTAAFSSGSSNGAGTATAANMAAFGMGSETVSSGRSPASNNALVAYTPSRGVLSCRGIWPLYVTCDVPVPMTRSVNDMLEVLSVIVKTDETIEGDFWREQTHVQLPQAPTLDYASLAKDDALNGKRIAVPKMYIGQKDSDPYAKYPVVSPEVIALWEQARADLEALGAEVVYTDFPLVTKYENDSVSGEANNVIGAPSDWNTVERTTLIAKAWSDFLKANKDPKIRSLADVDPLMLFPKPKDYLPDTWIEARNWVNYAALPDFEAQLKNVPMNDFPGLAQALPALEAQRKRDFEDWMDALKIDCVVFPAQGDVGLADLESNLESARHSLQNGVKYSNGNRAIRHLGVPTVSVPMGIMKERRMPVNISFAGKGYDDGSLLSYAYAYEQHAKRRIPPPASPALPTDMISTRKRQGTHPISIIASASLLRNGEDLDITISGHLESLPTDTQEAQVEVYVDGKKSWAGTNVGGSLSIEISDQKPVRPDVLGWDLKPLPPRPVMVIIIARCDNALPGAELLWASEKPREG
ncbi:amidase signature domain-containing protein [Lophiotrema nucula]|uniref:Amidase signature domain-containing protein n=1 Tax=Lophiotrema nucula TaxID=690887 RepID=A0A6A5ZQ27_9PLEO|nr:amidase signature domain-containing protein [Lophiotrema nucula]